MLRPRYTIASAIAATMLLALLTPRIVRALSPQRTVPRRGEAAHTRMNAGGETTGSCRRIIDSHLHVWSDGEAPFEWDPDQIPPEHLQGAATAERLLEHMERGMVSGALIVQPINHKFDHSYVKSVIDKYPTKFKGMCLANPNQSATAAVAELAAYKEAGFVGVRFNPYLWAEGTDMTNRVGESLYEKAGKLKMPVGFMCYKGYHKHADEIEHLVTTYPKTRCVIDHMGFFWQDGLHNRNAWAKLLELAQHDQVYVKASAFFRNSEFVFPHQDIPRKLREIVDVFGADRVMFGSDFPFVLDHTDYDDLVLAMFTKMKIPLTPEQLDLMMHGTSEKVFGTWE